MPLAFTLGFALASTMDVARHGWMIELGLVLGAVLLAAIVASLTARPKQRQTQEP
jgi:membrane protein DedA with SNARE-associated domain